MRGAFPGRVFGAEAASLIPGQPGLTQADVDACPYRHVVAERVAPEVIRCWLLADDARFAAIPEQAVMEAVGLIRAGAAVSIMGRVPEAAADVLHGLLAALNTTGAVGTA